MALSTQVMLPSKGPGRLLQSSFRGRLTATPSIRSPHVRNPCLRIYSQGRDTSNTLRGLSRKPSFPIAFIAALLAAAWQDVNTNQRQSGTSPQQSLPSTSSMVSGTKGSPGVGPESVSSPWRSNSAAAARAVESIRASPELRRQLSSWGVGAAGNSQTQPASSADEEEEQEAEQLVLELLQHPQDVEGKLMEAARADSSMSVNVDYIDALIKAINQPEVGTKGHSPSLQDPSNT